MKAEIINPFIEATLDVVRNFAQIELTKDKLELVSSPFEVNSVAGIIGLTGSLEGNFIISMPEISAQKLASKIIGYELEKGNELVTSCVGEIANQIGGKFIRNLPQDHHVYITPPQVVIGIGMKVSSKSPIFSIAFINPLIGVLKLNVTCQESRD